MSSLLVQAILNRDLQTDWGQFSVRAPTVGEALTILATASEAVQGVGAAGEVLDEILAGWLPVRLASALHELNRNDYIVWLLSVVNEGVPPVEDNDDERDDTKPIYRSRDEWEDRVADYAHCYGQLPSAVLHEPWPAFLLFVGKVHQCRARNQYAYLSSKAIQFAKDDVDRERMWNDLIERGNLPVLDRAAEYQRKLRLQPGWLKDLEPEFERIRNHPKA